MNDKVFYFGMVGMLFVVMFFGYYELYGDRIEIDYSQEIYDISQFTKMEGSNPTAKNVLIEFGDYMCGYCRQNHADIVEVLEQYGDKVNYVYKHLIAQGNEESLRAAEAAECSRDQGKFLEYHDRLYNEVEYDIGSLLRYGSELGLDIELLESCILSREKTTIIGQDIREGMEAAVTGTPTFFYNGIRMPGLQKKETFMTLLRRAE